MPVEESDMKMIRYEFKKIFGSMGSRIALLLMAAALVISCWSSVNGYGTEWVNEKGDAESGPAAIAKLRAARKEWTGPLDLERLTAAMLENQRINATPEAQSNNDERNNIAYGWKQGISDIRDVVNKFLAEDFNSYSYYLADGISLSALPDLYESRVNNLKDWLWDEATNADNMFPEAEKRWLLEQYEALETPMEYDYFLGWNRVAETSPTIIMLVTMLLGYLVAGIFSNEFRWRTDSVYFTSMLGRTANTRAKIWTGFLLVTGIYWITMLIFSLYSLIYLGFDGWNCPVQLTRWKCFYNVTFLEQYLLILLGGYLGNLFSAFVAMWISARTRSAIVPATLPFLLIFLPNFFQNYEGSFVGDVLGLLPDRLLQINYSMNFFDVYSLGSFVTGAIPILFVLYILLTILLVPLLYRSFSRKEIG